MKKYLKKSNWVPYIVFLPFSMLKYTVFALILEFIMDGAGNNSFVSLASLWFPALIITFLFCFVVIAQFITKWNKTIIIQNALRKIRRDLITKILNKEESIIVENQDSYVSLLFNDLKLLESDYYPNIFIIIEQSIGLSIAVYMIFTRSWKLGILLMIGLFIPSIFPKLFKTKTQRASIQWSQSNQTFTKGIQEILKGIVTIKSYNNETVREKEADQCLITLFDNATNLAVIKDICSSLILGTGLIVTALCFLYGAYLVSINEITIGCMMAVMQMSNAIYEPITAITNSRNTILSTRPIQKKITNELAGIYKVEKANLQFNEFKEVLELKDIQYAIEGQVILNRISLKIKKGMKILVVGPNGSGKSTLFKILQGRITDYEGDILVDGNSIKNKAKEEMYAMIGFVQQNVFVFDDTLINNITLKKPYEIEDILQAIKISNLHDVEKEKKDKLLGENGAHLSGGQKQRIEIARALITNRDILLMDEAFSAIDKESGYKIESTILQDKRKTILSIAHTIDIHVLKQYDLVIVINNGRIHEMDTPENCLNNTNSFIQSIV